jgi:hypothetical protein
MLVERMDISGEAMRDHRSLIYQIYARLKANTLWLNHAITHISLDIGKFGTMVSTFQLNMMYAHQQILDLLRLFNHSSDFHGRLSPFFKNIHPIGMASFYCLIKYLQREVAKVIKIHQINIQGRSISNHKIKFVG